MRSARIGAFAAAIAIAVFLTGCSTLDRIVGADDWKDWTPDSTSIQVSADDSVTETIFDTLDQSWYEGNELQDMIARSMNEYNEGHTPGAVNVKSYSDADGQVKVVIRYQTGDDFSEYNNVMFFAGSILEAQMKGFLFDSPFYVVDGAELSGGAIDSSEPLSHKEYSVVISDGTHVVQVPGEIRYVSDGARLVNSHVATAESSEGESVSVPSLYIIYEKDQEPPLLPSAAEIESGTG